jgi:hypothetical protein
VSKSTFIEEDLETDPQAADAVAAAAAALVSEQEAENETWVECSSQKVRAWLLWMSNNTTLVA